MKHAEMRKFAFCALALFASGAARAETEWERYVAQPTPANARAVNTVDYSPGSGQPLMRDLEVLQRQVMTGEREAVRLVLRVAAAEPVFAQWLYPTLGRLSQTRPRLVLEELQRAGAEEPRELVLTLSAEPPELHARAAALRSVADPALLALRDDLVAALQQRAAALETLARSPVHRQVAILDASFGERLTSPCSRPGPRADGFWNPGAAEVLAAEERLAAYLAEARQCGAPLQAPQRYLRQYVGVNVEGRRVLYLNAFDAEAYAQMKTIEPTVADWRTHPYDTCQAGAAHWGAEYDPGKARFENLACSAGSPSARP